MGFHTTVAVKQSITKNQKPYKYGILIAKELNLKAMLFCMAADDLKYKMKFLSQKNPKAFYLQAT